MRSIGDSFYLAVGLAAVAVLFWTRRRRSGEPLPVRFVVARLHLLAAWLAVRLAAVGACLAALAGVPQLVVLVVVLAVVFRKKVIDLGGHSHGTACWADSLDFARGGFLEPRGLPLGLVEPPTRREASRYLHSAPYSDSERVCRFVLAAWTRKPLAVWANRWVTALVVGPSGSGKTRSLLVNYVLACRTAVVVSDPKAEIFLLTAPARRAAGLKVVALDPFGVTGTSGAAFNPLDLIDPRDPAALDNCRALAESLVVRDEGGDKERHWNDTAVSVLTTFIAFVAVRFREANLLSVAALLADREGFAKALIDMRAGDEYGGHLAVLAGQLSHLEGKELGSVMSTVNRHLSFVNSPLVAASLKSSTIDPRHAAEGWLSVHLVLPPDKLVSHSGLLRTWLTGFVQAAVRTGLKPSGRLTLVLDELAALGRLDAVDQAVTVLRGYGVRTVLALQSLGQLKKLHPEDDGQTLLSNADLQVFVAVRDHQSAEYVSNCLGKATIVTTSVNGGTSSSYSHSADHGSYGSRSDTVNSGYTVQETERSLLQPNEVRGLPQGTAIVLADGIDPFTTTLVPCHSAAVSLVLDQVPAAAVVGRCVGIGLLAMVPALLLVGVLLAGSSPSRGPSAPTPATRPVTFPVKTLDEYAREGERKAREMKRAFDEAEARGQLKRLIPLEETPGPEAAELLRQIKAARK